jgi:hypothetical protein
MRYAIAFSSLLAALALAAPQAGAQGMGQNGRFCLKDSGTSAVQCKYETMAACEKDKKGNTDQCVPNTNTTGMGGAGGAGGGMKK